MRYDIGLKITYAYASPADTGRHALLLMPMDLPGEQRLIAGNLDVRPTPEERLNKTDFFGNPVTEIAYRKPHSRITFSVQARVERLIPNEFYGSAPNLENLNRELQECRDLGPTSPLHFRAQSPRVIPHAMMTDYARAQTAPDWNVRDMVLAIGQALHRDMKFDPEATTVTTTPLEAFSHKHGVCQDFSHVMIACLRGLGIPAGYVSGFLRTIPPQGTPRLEGADAMHAWVRAWCGAACGWIEYDPTNAMTAGTDHIVVARGLDYADVAPVRGVLRTAGGQTSKQAVDVIPLEDMET
ncbi:transglutaminase family protein [Magnetospira thiophila]